MFCTNCGKDVEELWRNCPFCGTGLSNEKGNEVWQEKQNVVSEKMMDSMEEEEADIEKRSVTIQPKLTGMETKGYGVMSIVSMILGIVGLVLSCVYMGIIPSIVGCIFSSVEMNQGKKDAMVITGFITSIVGIVFSAFMILLEW